MKKILLFILCFVVILLNHNVFAQPGCASVTITTNGGNNIVLPCAQPCITLNASAIQTSGETSTYTASSIPYSPPYAYNTGTPILVNIDDRWSNIISLPFTFCFYGTAYNQIIAGSNGVVSFTTTDAGGYCSWSFSASCPSSSLILNSIFGVYHDINPAVSGSMYYAILGTYPCRTFVVNWYNIPMYSCTSIKATHQIVIYETSNIIEVYIQNKPLCSSWNSGYGIVGIQNATGTVGLTAPGRNTSQWTASNEAWRFTPTGNSVVGISWYQGATQIGTGNSINVCPSGPTTYTAQATYNTCTGIPVTVNDNISISLSGGSVVLTPSSASICNGGSVNITASGSNTYTWSPGSGLNTTTGSNVTATPSTTTTYTVTGVTPGCTTTNSITITVNPQPAVSNMSATICSGGNFTLTPVNGVNGVVPSGTTYSWPAPAVGGITGTAAGSNAGNISGTLTNSTNGPINVVYTVTPKVGSCTGNTFSVTVTVNPNPVITPTATPASVCVGTSSSLAATSNVVGTTYAWMPGSLNGSPVTVSPAAATTYTVTGSAAGCTGTASVTVTISSNPVLTATATPASICSGTSSSLSATSTSTGTTYVWTPGNLSGSPVSVSPTSTTTYTVTGNAAGCTGQATVTVSINPNAVVSATASPTAICIGSSSTLTASGASTYTWMPGSLSGTSISVSPTTTTTYTVNGTTVAGCTGSNTVTVNVNPNPIVTPTATPASICIGTSSSLTATSNVAGTTYAWMPGSLTGSPVSVSPSTTTTYTVTGSAAGCTGTASVTVTISPNPVLTAAATPASICLGTSSSLAATSTVTGTTYAWTPGNLSGSPVTVSPTTATTYTVTGTAAGCTGQATVTVSINPDAVVSATALPAAICIGSSSTLTASGASTYTWMPGSLSGGSISVSPTTTTTYTVNGTTAEGCTGSNTVTVSVNPNPVITFATMPLLCNTSPAFTLNQASPAGGTYSGPGITGGIFDPAVAGIGTHSIIYDYTNPITGCSNSDTTQITISGALTINVTPNSPFICDNNSVLLTANGAYNFSWQPYSSLSSATGSNVVASPVSTTTYSVVGTNPDGCMGSTTVTVNLYPVPTLNITALPKEGCSPLDVSFAYGPVGPIDTNTIMWNFGDLSSVNNTSTLTAPTHMFYNNGNYTIYLSAKTIEGCPVYATDTVRVFKKPTADFYHNPIVAFSDNPTMNFIDLSFNTNAWEWNFGDPGSYNYNNSNLQSPIHIYSDSGTFLVQLIVSSSQSCFDTITKPITIYPEILIYIPNAFTPDADGLNEFFKPIMTGIDQSKYDFYIYDRWGVIQFHTNDLGKAWDGKHNGKNSELGVYVYYINYYSITGKNFKLKGRVTLIR